MVTDNITPPIQLGEIDDGPFGKVPLYMASLFSEINKIYQWRQENELSESGDITDEFFFLGASDAFGTAGETINFTSNNVSKKGEILIPPKVGKEPLVLFKAYFHLIGTFIEPVPSSDLDIKSTLEGTHQAYFNLPKIPYEMISKLDSFFREVDKKFGTEGIVLLTYDFDYFDAENSSDGWGFGVPDQKNTGAHCDYNKANVIAEITGQTRIVGTVHSHPHMRAYASSTDHNDQAGFDGIHITFGWSNQTKGETEYHAEMVRGDNFTWIPAEDVLDLENEYVYELNVETSLKKGVVQIPLSDLVKVKRQITVEEEELKELLSNVTKANHMATGNYNNSANQGKTGDSGKALSPTSGPRSFIDQNNYLPTKTPDIIGPSALQKFGFTEGNYPDPMHNNVVIRINDDPGSLDYCKLCDTVWDTSDQFVFGAIDERRQCVGCGVFVLLNDETLEDMNIVRKTHGYYPLENFYQYDIPTVVWDLRYIEFDNWVPSYEVLEASGSKK